MNGDAYVNDDADVNDDAGPSMGASRVDRQVFDAMVANLRSRLAQILPLPEEGNIKRDGRVWIGVHEVIGAMRCPRSITISSSLSLLFIFSTAWRMVVGSTSSRASRSSVIRC